MSEQERANLAKQQADMLAAIFSENPTPGMDADQLKSAADVLHQKRRREAALAAPKLAATLAEKFNELFTEYAHQNAYPHHHGPIADAAAFGTYLKKRNALPAEAQIEHMFLHAHTGRRAQVRFFNGQLVVIVIRIGTRIRMFRL